MQDLYQCCDLYSSLNVCRTSYETAGKSLLSCKTVSYTKYHKVIAVKTIYSFGGSCVAVEGKYRSAYCPCCTIA
jgi:hypothetical protein